MRSKVRTSARSKITLYIFFAAFAIAGLITVYLISYLPLKKIYDARRWIPYQAEVTASKMVSHRSDNSTSYRVEINYQYVYQGNKYSGNRYDFIQVFSSGYKSKQKEIDQHPAGTFITIYINPNHPRKSVIHRNPGWSILFTLFPLPFLAIGFGGLYYTCRKKSAQSSATDKSNILDSGRMVLYP